MNKHYNNLIFTDHAVERLQSRAITQGMVEAVVSHPHKTFSREDTTKFIKTIDSRKLHVVAQYLKDEKKWLIISVWVRGEDDKQPLAWRIFSFPFWLAWKIVRRVLNM